MDKKFINWRVIMQSLLGKSTGVDDEQVEEWLHEDARNQEYYEKAKYYFDNYYSGEKEIHQINMKKAWDDFLVYTKKSRNNIWKRYLQYVVPLFRTAGGLGAQRLPVQDAHQITGFHSGLADHIGLRLGALYHVKGCRKDAHIA